MRKANTKKLPKHFKSKGEVAINVTREDYEANSARGIPDEFNLKPGRQVFTRGRFDIPKEAFDPRNIKVRITINVDADILEYFKKRARQPDVAPYQTQINTALRRTMESEEAVTNGTATITSRGLLHDKAFIRAVAKEVRKELQR